MLVHGSGGRGYGLSSTAITSGNFIYSVNDRSINLDSTSRFKKLNKKCNFSLGCYQWKFLIVKENRGNEGTCVGVSRYPIKDYNHRTTTDMWLYRAYRYIFNLLDQTKILNFTIFSGNLYHNGELPLSLPSFTQGDYITAVLDMDARTLSFGKNGEEPRLAFEDIDSMELYPCVMFYSNSPGEKVRKLIII
jgi:E3 ubiquitin-protein ligase HERC1